jgi:hypothetical protein
MLNGANVTAIHDTEGEFDDSTDAMVAETYKRIGYKSVYAFAIRRE